MDKESDGKLEVRIMVIITSEIRGINYVFREVVITSEIRGKNCGNC